MIISYVHYSGMLYCMMMSDDVKILEERSNSHSACELSFAVLKQNNLTLSGKM